MPPGHRFILLLTISLAACLPATRSDAADRPWLLLESPHFTIISQFSEKETRAWAEEFDDFSHAINQRFQVDRRLLRPLTVVLFNRDRDLHPYKILRPDGKTRNASGFFASRETWSVIGLSGEFARDETRRIFFHEAVHWFTDARTDHMHPWLREGLAEVYSTFRSQKGKVSWGSSIPHHFRLLRSERLLPLRRLLTLSDADPLFNEESRTGIFYAQSWAFVHFIMFGKESGYEDALGAYAQALHRGLSVDEAFAEAFRAPYEKVQRDFENYLRRGKFFVRQRDASGDGSTEHQLRPASPGAVEIALARLALGSNRLTLARNHAARAVEVDPENPGGHEILAWFTVERAQQRLSGDQGMPVFVTKQEWPDVDKILEHSNRAVELGSTDAWMHVLLGYHCEYPGFLKSRTADRIAHYSASQYKRAINLRPNILMAYQNLAIAVGSNGIAVDGDRPFLQQGRKLYPRDSMIVLGLAMITDQQGDRDAALQLLEEAKGEGMVLIPAARNIASQLESRLTVDSLQTEIDSLLAKRDILGALERYDLEIARAGNTRLKRSLEEKRFHLAYDTGFKLAIDAMDRGDFDEATLQLERLLGMDGISHMQRNTVIDTIRDANRRRLQSL